MLSFKFYSAWYKIKYSKIQVISYIKIKLCLSKHVLQNVFNCRKKFPVASVGQLLFQKTRKRYWRKKCFQYIFVYNLYVRSTFRYKKPPKFSGAREKEAIFDMPPVILYHLFNKNTCAIWKRKDRPVWICTSFVHRIFLDL